MKKIKLKASKSGIFVSISTSDKLELEAITDRTGIIQSNLIRQGIKEIIANYKRLEK